MSFDDMMKELREEYVAELPAKIQEIEKNLQSSNHDQLRDNFHKLKGTGKTYGIPEISQLGEVVEKICVYQPQKALTAIPVAVDILRDIHGQRKAEQAFNLSSDQRFSQLKSHL